MAAPYSVAYEVDTDGGTISVRFGDSGADVGIRYEAFRDEERCQLLLTWIEAISLVAAIQRVIDDAEAERGES
jgi:hypothetical protein